MLIWKIQDEFTKVLKDKGIKISMDGKGRAMDNIFIERLWRSVKYEEIYVNEFQSVEQLRKSLKKYFDFYRSSRRAEHWSPLWGWNDLAILKADGSII